MRCKQFLTLSAATLILAAALTGCGASSSTASSAATSEAASSAASSVAATSEAASEAAATLPDGVYTADFETDSSMVHANEACDGKGTLTVKRRPDDLPRQPCFQEDRQPVSGQRGRCRRQQGRLAASHHRHRDLLRRYHRRGVRLRYPPDRRRRGLCPRHPRHQGQVVRPHRQRPQRRTQGRRGRGDPCGRRVQLSMSCWRAVPAAPAWTAPLP